MKHAEIADAWRRLGRRDTGFRVESFTANDKPPIASGTHHLAPGLTVVCGLNGVGKTTLLRMIGAAFSGSASIENQCRPELLATGSFSVRVKSGDAEQDFALGDDPIPTAAALVIDAFALSREMLELSNQTNASDLLDGIEAKVYSAKELKIVNYVAGRSYGSIRVYEVENTVSGDGVLPVFEVSRNGLTYRNPDMGLGELSLITTLWLLGRAEAGSVILLEEPETFLSARSASSLLNVLARRVVKKNLYSVITTHSSDVLARVPSECIRVMVPDGAGVAFRVPRSKSEVRAMLGMQSDTCRIILVEDTMASLFLSSVLNRVWSLWSQAATICACGGAEQVVSLCEKMPQLETFRLIGVLDGDQPEQGESRHPIYLLPGAESPESVLRDAALADRTAFCGELGIDIDGLNIALEAIEGRDPHDWFPELAQQIGRQTPDVATAALACWMSKPTNATQADELGQAVIRALAI